MQLVSEKHLHPDTEYHVISRGDFLDGHWIYFYKKDFNSVVENPKNHPVKFSVTLGNRRQLPQAFDLFFGLAQKYNVLAFKLLDATKYFGEELNDLDNKKVNTFNKLIRIYGPSDSYLSPEKTPRTAQEWKYFFTELESIYRENKIIFPERKNMPMLDTQIGDYCCYRVEYRQMSNGGLHLFLNCEEQDSLHPWHRELNPESNSNNWVGSSETTYQIHPFIQEENRQEEKRQKVVKLLQKIQKISENFKQCQIHINRVDSLLLGFDNNSYRGKLMIEIYVIDEPKEEYFVTRKKKKQLLLSFLLFLCCFVIMLKQFYS